jgi:hypothetical protein
MVNRLVRFLSTVAMGTPRFLSAKKDVQIMPTKMTLTGIHSCAILKDLQAPWEAGQCMRAAQSALALEVEGGLQDAMAYHGSTRTSPNRANNRTRMQQTRH